MVLTGCLAEPNATNPGGSAVLILLGTADTVILLTRTILERVEKANPSDLHVNGHLGSSARRVSTFGEDGPTISDDSVDKSAGISSGLI